MTRSPHRLALALLAAVLALWIGAMASALRSASLTDEAQGTMLALFPPGTPSAAHLAAIIDAGGRPVRPTWLPFAWIVNAETPGLAGRLKAEGAIAALPAFPFIPVMGGCVTLTDAEQIRRTRDLLR